MSATKPPTGRLDPHELRLLLILLARYCATDLDYFENWKLELPYGPVYVTIANALPTGAANEAFHTVWPLPPHLADAGEPDDAVNARHRLGELRAWLTSSLRIAQHDPHPSGLTAISVPDDADIIEEVRRLRALADQIEAAERKDGHG